MYKETLKQRMWMLPNLKKKLIKPSTCSSCTWTVLLGH